MSDLPELTIQRQFNAPPALVWRAWTDPTHLQRWYGPNVETVIHEFSLQPGGVWKNEMKMGKGSNYELMVFQEVAEPEKLVWHHSSADADWNVTSNPMMPNWPQTFLTTAQFSATGGGTQLNFSQSPLNASEAEIATFANALAGMQGGWGKGFDIVEEILAELAA